MIVNDSEGCSLYPCWVPQFYNVLWIEWEAGIAHRRSIGTVWADYWDKAEKKEIDVRFG